MFIWKETDFCSLKKSHKAHSDLFLLHHTISPFSELHNNILLYQLWHSNLRVKKRTPYLFAQMLLVNPLQSCNAWQACAQQTEKNHSHTNSAVSRQVYVHALLVQHLYSRWWDSNFLRTDYLTPGLTNNRFSHYHLITPDLSQHPVRWIKPYTNQNRFLRTSRMPSLYKMNFFTMWFGRVQHQKLLGWREGRKLIKIHRFYRAEEDTQ